MSIDDQQLEQLARRLGSRAVEKLDFDETARSVVERLKSEPEPVVWWRRAPRLSLMAAAAVLVMAIGIFANGGGDNASTEEQNSVPTLLELQALSDEELEEVYDSLWFEAPVSELVAASLDDMTVGQLEELLQTMMED